MAGRLSHADETRTSRFAYALLACLVLLLAGRLFTVQVVQHRKFLRLALEKGLAGKSHITRVAVVKKR